MPITAAVGFRQGAFTEVAGRAAAGLPASFVTCRNNDDTGVTTWSWEMLAVPPGSAVPLGVFSIISTAVFTPDVQGGSWAVQLTVSDGSTIVVDVRVFSVPTAVHAWIVPAYNQGAAAHNYNGQLRGWAGPNTVTTLQGALAKLVDSFLLEIDAGLGAYTVTTADYVQPIVTGLVTVHVVSTLWMSVGAWLYIAGGGYCIVTAIPTPTSVQVMNSGAFGNAGVGSTVSFPAKVVMSGAPGPIGPPWQSSPWLMVPAGSFAATAVDDATVHVTSGEWEDAFQVGRAVRVLDNIGLLVNDILTIFSSAKGITGLQGAVDTRGRLYVLVEEDSPGHFHADVFNRYSCGAATKVAHTGDHTVIGGWDLIEDNGSGVGGWLVVAVLDDTEGVPVAFEFYTWHVVHSFDPATGNLVLDGCPIPIDASAILSVWYSPSGLQVKEDIVFVAGAYDVAAHDQVMDAFRGEEHRWWGPPARLVQLSAQESTHANTHYINGGFAFYQILGPGGTDGLKIEDANVYETAHELNRSLCVIENGVLYDFSTTIGGAGDENVTVAFLFVFE